MKQVLFSLIFCVTLLIVSCGSPQNAESANSNKIDREAVVLRNNPHVLMMDSLSSLSVGNGNFAFTVDATGLQSFPEMYKNGVCLGTQSQWGWHSFPNVNNYKPSETLKLYDFGRGRQEPYAVQFNEAGRQQAAANYYRENEHRLHLGIIGLEMTHKDGTPIDPTDVKNIDQHLNLWKGLIESNFTVDESKVSVETACDTMRDAIGAQIQSSLISSGQLKIKFHFPYPSGGHVDDACNWNAKNDQKHASEIIQQGEQFVVFKRTIDTTVYYVRVDWTGNAAIEKKSPHYFLLVPQSDTFSFTACFTQTKTTQPETYTELKTNSSEYWNHYWNHGGFVDFGACKDPRAKELERRVILSQYLLAIQCAGNVPPQETGLTFNSWYGKFHLEMHWWHAVHFALWNRTELMERSLGWYAQVEPQAEAIAKRQGYDGVRWMKMTDPQGTEAPSKVGSFLIWQQPHFIYMANLVYRHHPSPEVLNKYKDLVFKTARFMASFATYDSINNRYTLKGIIPAQETLKASETINPPFELSYWHYALGVAQKWREAAGLPRNKKWDDIITHLSPLAEKDSLYLAAETAPETYHDIRFTSDHMAVLGAWGILPNSPSQFNKRMMSLTLDWIYKYWNWDQTWGWDYPMSAMCAARLSEPEKAVNILLMNERTNTYLVSGHNYQDSRLRIYLPGNGGLLTAVAMMCAGWDGNTINNPGFPKDGNWNVKWEDLVPMP